MDLEREEGEECEENMEVFDDSSSSPSGTLRNYPLTCKVLYSYKVTTHSPELHSCYSGTHRYTSVHLQHTALLCAQINTLRYSFIINNGFPFAPGLAVEMDQ